MKKKSFIVIVILLIAIILGLCVFIAYDKNLFGIKGETKKKSNNIVEKKDDTNTTKEVDINSELVKNLVYPKSNSDNVVAPTTFILKDESVDSYTFDYKIAASVDDEVLTDDSINKGVTCYIDTVNGFSLVSKDGLSESYCSKFSEDIIKNKFLKLFGPDIKYEPQSIEQTGCAYPKYYDSQTNSYYGVATCGGVFAVIKSISKTYKAELNGDYLNIYDYALISFEHDSIDGVLLFNDYDSFSKYYPTMEVTTGDYVVNNESEAQSKLEELINSGKANTYIWTFKKQSDGKYYYYSSKWQ